MSPPAPHDSVVVFISEVTQRPDGMSWKLVPFRTN